MVASTTSRPKGSTPRAHARPRADVAAQLGSALRPRLRRAGSRPRRTRVTLGGCPPRWARSPAGGDRERGQALGAGEHQPAWLQIGQGAQGLQRLEAEQDVGLAVADLGALVADQEGGLDHAAALGHTVDFAGGDGQSGGQSRTGKQGGGGEGALTADAGHEDAQACAHYASPLRALMFLQTWRQSMHPEQRMGSMAILPSST